MDGDGAPEPDAGDGPSAGPTHPDVYGQTWVYESIVGALPGVDVSDRVAVALQFALFEGGVLALAAAYGLRGAVLPGTAAVLVAAVGSAFMLDIGARVRRLDVPGSYARVLFGSSVEVVLGVVAYVALLTYLFVYDPRADPVLVADLLGPRPPVLPAALLLLVLWDVCYRVGTAWWTAVVALWRSLTTRVDPETRRGLRTADARVAGFALLQLVLVPFVVDHPLLVGAAVGHVVATLVVVGASRRLEQE